MRLRSALRVLAWAALLGGCSRGCLDDAGSAQGDPKAAPPGISRPPKWAMTLGLIGRAARRVQSKDCKAIGQSIESQKAVDAWGRPLWVRCTGEAVEICSSGDDGVRDPGDAGTAGDDQCLDFEKATAAGR
jgi:hypothetical protein